jgi:TonB family protein
MTPAARPNFLATTSREGDHRFTLGFVTLGASGMSLKRLACALVLAQCAYCIGLSAQGIGSGNGTATPSARDAAEEAQYGPLAKIGHGVTAPVVTRQSEPEYSQEARKKKFNGTLLIGLVVDKQGRPQDVHIIRGVGMGLDENALKAVSHYRFRPAMENGQPVAVRINVEVNFQIFQGPQGLDGPTPPRPGEVRDASQP